MKNNTYFAVGIDMIGRAVAPFTLEMFLKYMPIILDSSRAIAGAEERRGYLTLMNGVTGEIIFTAPFGEIPEEKREKYFEFSQEKAVRLFSQINMNLPDNHTTSFQSRNESENQYAGAICVNYHSSLIILSFSGMPELVDEAMMLVLAKKLAFEIKKTIRGKIEGFARNPYWEDLYRKVTN